MIAPPRAHGTTSRLKRPLHQTVAGELTKQEGSAQINSYRYSVVGWPKYIAVVLKLC